MNKKRALINMHTRFENIPKEWLNQIEPFVVRGPFLPCWVWCGALDRNGYPIKNVDGVMVMVHRYVAKIFYDFPDNWYVKRECNVQNCVNPNHLVITTYRKDKKLDHHKR